MTKDKKVLYAISAGILFFLLLALFIPYSSSRIISAILLLFAVFLVHFFIKRRTVPSFNKNQVALISAAFAVVYIMLVYLTGLYFGFGKRSNSGFSADVIFSYLLPVTVIIVTTELIRRVLVAWDDKISLTLCYLATVCADVLIVYNVHDIINFNRFMDFFAGVLLPAIISNLVFCAIARSFGALPNLSYRLITVLYAYLIPAHPLIPDALYNVMKLIMPILLYGFISILFIKKRKYALKRSLGKWGYAIAGVVLCFMISIVMLISCQFKYGLVVIATESMTGELNKGDAFIYERYDDQIITEGQIIAFIKNGSTVVHRVESIERIDGINRYYTKGDANDSLDSGYVTDADVVGVAEAKLPYVGYPTLWLRKIVTKGIG